MRFLLLLSLASFASAADLTAVKNVYLLPMQSGFDQFLAGQFTERKVFTVVTDPLAADAIFTDRIGEGFEEKLAELYPEESSKPKEEKSEADVWASKRPRSASFSRGRGNLFLIDRKTREVIWSTYSPPRSAQPKDLNRNAGSIVKKLGETLQPKVSGPSK